MKKYYFKFFLIIALWELNSHDLWIEKKSNNIFELKYGHIYPHSKENYAPQSLPYNKESIKQALCITKAKKNKLSVLKSPLELPECEMYLIEFSTGFWTQTIEGLKNEAPEKIKTKIIDSWESTEYLKQIFSWDDSYLQAQGEGLEIIPLENPFKKNIGDKFLIQILYHNKPIQELPVAYGDDVRGITDKEGKYKIRLQKKGYQIIRTTLTNKSETNIKKIITSTLIFQLYGE